MASALTFRTHIGGEHAIMDYIHNMAVQAGRSALAGSVGPTPVVSTPSMSPSIRSSRVVVPRLSPAGPQVVYYRGNPTVCVSVLSPCACPLTGSTLSSMWATDTLLTDASMYGAMVDVRLPTTNASVALGLPARLLAQYSTWVPTYDIGPFGGPPGTFYVRVSCQVYTEISDIEMLGHAVLALIAS